MKLLRCIKDFSFNKHSPRVELYAGCVYEAEDYWNVDKPQWKVQGYWLSEDYVVEADL